MSQGQVPPRGVVGRGWRESAAPAAGGAAPASGRGKKLVGLLAVLLALAGAVAALLFYVRNLAAPDVLSLAIREYQSPLLPPNALALQDSLVLEKRFAAGKVDRPYNVQRGDDILLALKELRKKTSAPVVVHISALARWSDGKVFLLGGDADPDRAASWVPLEDILQRIRDCPAPGKLLILDVMRPIADARFGILADDIAEKTQEALAAEKDLPFFVLCACSKGQLSLVSEELGQSVFAYYLDQGLRGSADGYGPHGRKDQRITVTELAEFVKVRVDRWAWQNRGVRQTPILLGKGDDFPLIHFRDTSEETTDGSTEAVAYPAWLREGWAVRDKAQIDLSQFGPSVLRSLDALLLRAEKRWRAGIEEARLKSEMQTDLQRIDEQIKRIADSRQTPPPRTLAMALASKKSANLALRDALRSLLPKAFNTASKIDEKDKAKKEELDKEFKQVLEAFAKEPLEGAAAVLEAATATVKLPPAQFALLLQLARQLELKSRFAETVFLDRVKAFHGVVQENDWEWPLPIVVQALQTQRQTAAISADLAQEPAFLSWVADRLKTADELRRKAEKELFAGLPTEWEQASRHLQEVERHYTAIRLRVESLRKAREVRDRALTLLPRLGPVLIARGRVENQEEQAWDAAVLTTLKIQTALAQPESAVDNADVFETAALRQNLNDLQRFFDAKVKRSLELGEDATADDYQLIQVLLENAGLTGPQREQLWRAGQKLALRLLPSTLALDDADNQGAATSISRQGDVSGSGRETTRRIWRARLAIDTMKLSGSAQAAKLEQAYQSTHEKSEDDAAWKILVRNLIEVWPRQGLVDFSASERKLPRADRLSRLLAPFDLSQVRSTERDHWSQNPALALFRKNLGEFWQWQSERCQADSAALEGDSPFRTFYTEAAEEYGRFANRLK